MAERNGKLGLAGLGWVIEGVAGAAGFGGLEEETSFFEVVREAGEAGFAVDVGADFEIELVKAAESVGYVNFDLGGINRLAGFVGDGEIGGTGADAGIDRGDGVRVGALRLSLGLGCEWKQEGQSECDF